jgi:hypothetical protein
VLKLLAEKQTPKGCEFKRGYRQRTLTQNRPKKPVSGYMGWLSENRKELTSHGKMMKFLTRFEQVWGSMEHCLKLNKEKIKATDKETQKKESNQRF